MNDLVEREAVLRTVVEQYSAHNELIPPWLDFTELPSVTQKSGKWIPVSERLPEEREWYLAVFKEKDTAYQLIPRIADYIGDGENKWQIIDEEGLGKEYIDILECIAWMPLPKPYEPQESEK